MSCRARDINGKSNLQRARVRQRKDIIQGTNTNISLETASQIPADLPHHIFAHNRKSLPLEFQLRDLVDFLHEHEGPEKILQMNCPLSGHPLPSIYLGYQQSGYANAKIEFSQPLATTFIAYVMNRRQV